MLGDQEMLFNDRNGRLVDSPGIILKSRFISIAEQRKSSTTTIEEDRKMAFNVCLLSGCTSASMSSNRGLRGR